MKQSIWTVNFITNLLVLATGFIAEILYLLTRNDAAGTVGYWGLSLASLLAINDLYRYGAFSKSRWKNLQFLFAAFFLAGILARIRHWEGGTQLLIAAWVGLVLLYIAWFISKPVRKLPDVLKVFWVMLFSCLTLLKQLHIYDAGIPGGMLTAALLYAIYIHLYVQRRLHPPQSISEWDFDREPPSGKLP